MEGMWEVTRDLSPVGHCSVEREGLYYRFRCRCTLPGREVSRLQVQVGEQRRKLGVLVPSAGSFVLECRIPVKEFPAGEPRFSIETPERAPAPEKERTFIPVTPEEPFSYLQRLEGAYLERREGKTGIVLGEEK